MHTPIHAVIFDHDGTLVDSEPVHLACWRQVLEPYNAALTEQDYTENLSGMPSIYSAAWLARKFNLDIAADALLCEKQKLLRDFLTKQPFPLMPGVKSLLTWLQTRGIPLAVATGASREEVQASLTDHNIRSFFASVISKEDVANNKPAPDVYQLAATQLAIKEAHCVAIEDSDNGERAARAAGMRCLRFHHRGTACTERFTSYTSLQNWFEHRLLNQESS